MKEDIGLIAQQVGDVFPEIVRTSGDGYLSIRDRSLFSILIKSIKEQQELIENQETRIKYLESLILQNK